MNKLKKGDLVLVNDPEGLNREYFIHKKVYKVVRQDLDGTTKCEPSECLDLTSAWIATDKLEKLLDTELTRILYD